ncbi:MULTISPECIES: YlaI family protein [Oceanobacillus]|uniref:DUF2197 domain-containing protein n=1 Tax=Oceanobacillus kimchii TaxID=746691 RepID=A0ABQ5TI87_9BACI|nr:MULTISPECIES: YlaI family protein [Oceanobacillus]MBT2598837.1 YlaI family protein [Oceanobacillus sp. ISL-74]MBT2651756.1 YlaI family protein [Oceanobacillus sp. ISL-73]MCT1576405.1 YlaI family protein [Oceanobacillus kimchii]MCT2136041.1 YlaI family protein [Oceanobacillus kimchii]OEH54537.1 hypothetical protein AQ616_12320 [Oceanobacillus sp. E9]
MQVKCTICDKVEEIEHYSLQAKRLRNRRKNMHLCEPCYDRIEKNTKKRLSTGKFKLYKETKKVDDFL